MNEDVIFSEIIRALRRRIRHITITILIFLVCGGAVGYWIPPVYEAELDVLVNATSGRVNYEVPSMGEIDTSLRLVETYKQIMKSDRVNSKVNIALEGKYPKSEIKKKIQIESGNASQIITVIAKDDTAEKAAILVNTYAQVFKEEIKNLMNLDNITIMSESDKSRTTKVKPDLFYYFIIATLAGAFMCITIILIREVHFTPLDSEEKINNVLQLPLIGSVKLLRKRFEKLSPTKKDASTFQRSKDSDFEMLAIRILHNMKKRNSKVLLVTSSKPREGKTFIASHLAATVANGSNQTVFVDANFRRPTGTVQFNIYERKGVTSVINRLNTISDVICKTDHSHLTFINTGPLPLEQSKLLQAKEWEGFISNLKARNDFIIIDAPEASLPDVHLLLPHVDSVLFVLNSNRSSKKDVQNCINSIRKLDGEILGIVRNEG